MCYGKSGEAIKCTLRNVKAINNHNTNILKNAKAKLNSDTKIEEYATE